MWFVSSVNDGALESGFKTDFGFHVIRLDGIEGGGTRAFADVRAELDQELRRDRAADRFGEQQEQAQRRAEQPGADFAAIAKDLGLATGEVPVFLRGTDGEPLGAGPALEAAVFGDKVLGQRKISAPIALGDDRFVVVKVASHTKAAIPPLASLRGEVVAAVQRSAEKFLHISSDYWHENFVGLAERLAAAAAAKAGGDPAAPAPSRRGAPRSTYPGRLRGRCATSRADRRAR